MPWGSIVLRESTRSSAELCLLARERVENGELPSSISPGKHAEFGAGQLCRLCRQRIDPEQIGYRLTTPSGANGLMFHHRCLDAWRSACVGWTGYISSLDVDGVFGASNREGHLESADRHVHIG